MSWLTGCHMHQCMCVYVFVCACVCVERGGEGGGGGVRNGLGYYHLLRKLKITQVFRPKRTIATLGVAPLWK